MSLAHHQAEPVPLTWLFRWVKPYKVQLTSTYGGNHVPNSYHYRYRAIDVFGTHEEMMRLMGATVRSSREFREAFYDPFGRFVKDGNVHLGAVGGHSDHVHLAR